RRTRKGRAICARGFLDGAKGAGATMSSESKKLWGGRFAKGTAAAVDQFHSSIGFDWRLYKEDIRASQAHARMLARCGIITQEEADLICQGLAGIAADIEAGRVEFS